MGSLAGEVGGRSDLRNIVGSTDFLMIGKAEGDGEDEVGAGGEAGEGDI